MFDLIDRELRTQYRIAYYPDPHPPAGTFRTLEVRAKCECKVRSRKAYLLWRTARLREEVVGNR